MDSLVPAVLRPPLNITLINSIEGLAQLQDFFSRCGPVLGWDIETDPKKDYFYRRIRTLQFGVRDEQFVIDLLAFCDGDPDKLFHAQGHYGMHLTPGLRALVAALTPVLCTNDYLKVGVNLGFEYQNFYWLLGLRTWHFFDCAMAERCIWAGALGSMKQYAFFSMEGMVARYLNWQIDKSLQTSFTLDGELTEQQLHYAAADTRFPIAIRFMQQLILAGYTPQRMRNENMPEVLAAALERINPVVLGDDLREIAQIENDAIGAFEDMHVHGERIDTERWIQRIAQKKIELLTVIAKELDPLFLPIVGSKRDLITEAQLNEAEQKWKSYNCVTKTETEVKVAIRKAKSDIMLKAALTDQLEALVAERKAVKEKYKKVCGDLRKKRTKIKNLSVECQGEALINYDSGAQLLAVLRGIKGLARLDDTEDETLKKHQDVPACAALRKYRTLTKEIGTYGVAWATQWTTHPCKEEGWLHPGDGRLHCIFNQYDAETGRSTSEKPNGQNLPQDKEVRSCFIADPPDEATRVSVCCDADCEICECDECKHSGG